MANARVLVCDDEAGLREMLGVLLRRAGYRVDVVDGVNSALARIEKERPFDAIISDLLMPDGSGMAVLQAARGRDEGTQIVMITAHATTEQAVDAMRKGAYDYIQKPFKNHQLLATLDKALEKRAIVEENKALRAEVRGSGDILGKSAAMKRVIDLVDRVASAPSSVLVTGESGTGKEVIARALHSRSSRAQGPFIVVNCGALPETLMESELFGHVKGAFTGADTKKPGLFQAANRGTLFLDEVGELPPPLQVKLLRALQERSVRPVGSPEEIPVDVRMVAATNRDLEQSVANGTFRQDLFYRLNVIRIRLPPLRERPEDIPLLAEHFLRKHAALQGRSLLFSPEALRWIGSQGYPGNVRELENVIERAVTLTTGTEIRRADLPEGGDSAPPPPGLALPESGFNLDKYLGDVERRLLLHALEQARGVRTNAAQLLGMTFRSFRYRLAKYGLSDGEDNGLSDEP